MEEKVKQQYDRWLSQPGMPADLADELNSIAGNEDAITDRFYRELEFGTGGLRGVIGAGTNRMNVYNIRKATQGLANYLNASDLPKKVAIGYDSRIKSDVFAKVAAGVFAANGIKVNIWPVLMPVPTVSFATAICTPRRVSWSRLLTTPASTTVIRSMQRIMQAFRGGIKEFGGKKVVKLLDYAPGLDGLPKSDVLKFLLEDNCSIVVRPSGTEPKLKTYISISAENKETAEKIEAEICKSAEEYLK